jgi:hypothetical protein
MCFVGIKNAVVGSWVLPPRFQRKARQGVTGSEYLQVAAERALLEAVRLNLKMQWRLQEVRGTRNVAPLPHSRARRRRPWGLQTAWRDYLSHLEFLRYYYVP